MEDLLILLSFDNWRILLLVKIDGLRLNIVN
jgi:hypothetical protein